ncbi:EscU/YscU/HrcU family type III secretion system export apparatus switch protein, partial [Pantoea agglomerans]|nr:EscU/YscU/HrcU family type III secretion system export apparatus switch protein [Pantoea agglomerans]
MSEKTEDATPQKLRESRKKGQVSQSQDIPKLLISIGILETLFAMVDTGMQRLQAMMLLPLTRLRDPFDHAMEEVISDSVTVMLVLVGIACAIAMLLRVVGGWVQFGPLFSTEALAPKPDALNPFNHLKNMFSARQFTQLLTSIFKAVVIGLVVWQAIMPDLGGLAQLALGDLNGFWQGVMALFMKVSRR